jgi:hypothetical protein
MQKQNRNALLGDFATFSTLVILFASAVALVGCGGGRGGSTAPNDPNSPPPCYDMDDEPFNDNFFTADPIAAGANHFMLEGYVHHMDLDCGIVIPTSGLSDRTVLVNFDYAYGWDMEMSVGYIDTNGDLNNLWGAYDSFALGHESCSVTVPSNAVDLTVSIGQRTLNSPPDSTRYTIEVEVL